MQLINLRFLSHPFNWAYVLIALALASMAFHQVFAGVNSASVSPD